LAFIAPTLVQAAIDGRLPAASEWRPYVISPLNGPVNTKDLACPHKFLASRRATPGPEFFRPETRSKFRRISPARDPIFKIGRRTGHDKAACSRKISAIRDPGDCVVGPGGLEPPTRPL